jgi:hypothetical protein
MDSSITEQILRQNVEWRYWFTVRSGSQIGELVALTSDSHWEITTDHNGQPRFAVWPSYELARICCEPHWPFLRPCPFAFDFWCEQWFDTLAESRIPIEAFPTTTEPGLRVQPATFLRDIEAVRPEYVIQSRNNLNGKRDWRLAGLRPTSPADQGPSAA